MAKDPAELAHQEWLGYVQPVGLVVSIPALLAAQAQVNRNIASEQSKLLAILPRDKDDEVVAEIRDFPEFTRQVLGWELSDLAGSPGGPPLPIGLEAALPEYHETLRPTYAVGDVQPASPERPWLMLIQCLPAGTQFDDLAATAGHWQATPHLKFERLLRETQVPIGLLCNHTHIRLVYAPRGETSGYLTFSVAEMASVAGRPIFAALHMLLSAERLFSLPEKQRLPAILADSRKYQNVVSTKLAEQVLAALYELVRGFQSADEQRKAELLREVLAENPNHVYGGLLTVLMRLVFLLYAEDRGLVSTDPLYNNFYSVTGLFDRLRADAGRYPDTMDLRYGAWAQLLTLFRLIYEGGNHAGLQIPPRHGYLFDPDRYNFLEGRAWKTARQPDKRLNVPRVSDGVIFRVLQNLLILDGERLSYRTLDVEQIGSVYETMMGFNLEVAQGRSIAIKPTKSHGAPTTINLEALLETKSTDRPKWLAEQSGQKIDGNPATALKAAKSIDELLAALDRKLAREATPNVVPKGAMILQPSDERRRSGSHYTPRSLTEPIVRTTLRPILEQLGERPKPEQILALKVCDPAMGSGAFLVEACRQLGDELVKAWHVHDCVPKLPPDEDEILHARRLVAQRCLYGVDKNPMAVDLAKLSLWLATLAKDHPFTFLDHSLRAGDSLVGLSREQIAAFHWTPKDQKHLLQQELTQQIDRATEARRKILSAPESTPYTDQQQALAVAEEALDRVRRLGDLIVAAFFNADRPRQREELLGEYLSLVTRTRGQDGKAEDVAQWLRLVSEIRTSDHPIEPFHWQIEFPEVFTSNTNERVTGGFDAIVGNPPFAGAVTLSRSSHAVYTQYLRTAFDSAGGKTDLVAFFFRRSFDLVFSGGTLGLIATNTIGQGDTRESGLLVILKSGGTIYDATPRKQWPGTAAVVVSVVHISKMKGLIAVHRAGKQVHRISAYLLPGDVDESPRQLYGQSRYVLAALGNKPNGMGFIFADNDEDCLPLRAKDTLLQQDGRHRAILKPYVGGSELNASPTLTTDRWIIDFGDRTLSAAAEFPHLLAIIKERVKPTVRRDNWWQFEHRASTVHAAIDASQLREILIVAETSDTFAFVFGDANACYSNKIVIFTSDSRELFAVLQSRVHELWARTMSSTLKDDLSYVPGDCFETFPFPNGMLEHSAGDSPTTDNYHLNTLETVGRQYYEFRAALMVKNNEGLTKTYNRFHDPDERTPDILKLRELHAAMDRAVLEAYGWHDLAETSTCEFLLDYEDEEDEEPAADGARRGRGRKKPWRYRWPDDFRDEVLARLLDLNQKRAEEERLAGLAERTAATGPKKSSSGKKKATSPSAAQPKLPGM